MTAFVPVCIAMTTTALGTLLPILREQNMLGGMFGRLIFAAGAVGELFPIVAISLFLRSAASRARRDGAPGVRKTLPLRGRIEMMFLTATALPLLVALAEIGVDSGVMLPENAAALVGAGVPSIAIFPFVATRIHRPSSPAMVTGASAR